jgi:hypothetical protein
MHLVRYLLSTKDTGLTYVRAPSPTVLFSAEGFCDSDYAGDVESRRSTTGYIFKAAGGAISWSSRIQPTVATSTMEAEYMSAASAAKEALWIRKLLAELDCSQPCVQIGCDNQAALSVIKNPVQTPKAKHIDIHHHFVRERAAMGQVAFSHIASASNPADGLTKALPKHVHRVCVGHMGMVLPGAGGEGE